MPRKTCNARRERPPSSVSGGTHLLQLVPPALDHLGGVVGCETRAGQRRPLDGRERRRTVGRRLGLLGRRCVVVLPAGGQSVARSGGSDPRMRDEVRTFLPPLSDLPVFFLGAAPLLCGARLRFLPPAAPLSSPAASSSASSSSSSCACSSAASYSACLSARSRFQSDGSCATRYASSSSPFFLLPDDV